MSPVCLPTPPQLQVRLQERIHRKTNGAQIFKLSDPATNAKHSFFTAVSLMRLQRRSKRRRQFLSGDRYSELRTAVRTEKLQILTDTNDFSI